MSNFYDTLWVNKNSSADEIKKAYTKKAMEFHPDRNKWNTEAEKKFKEVNEAYSTLSDPQKKQQYDMFGSTGGASWNPFWWAGWAGGFGGFEDIFSQFWGAAWNRGGSQFDFWDLFWGGFNGQSTQSKRRNPEPQEPVSLDFEKTYEVPIFDLILGCRIEVKGVYGNTAKLKIPANTKPGAKFRVKGFWKKEPGKEGNLIVIIDARMPKHISDVDMQMLERIRENIGY